MKVGDLVRTTERDPLRPTTMDDWTGIIVGWEGAEPIVFWNERFPTEIEYREQIEVVCEA